MAVEGGAALSLFLILRQTPLMDAHSAHPITEPAHTPGSESESPSSSMPDEARCLSGFFSKLSRRKSSTVAAIGLPPSDGELLTESRPPTREKTPSSLEKTEHQHCTCGNFNTAAVSSSLTDQSATPPSYSSVDPLHSEVLKPEILARIDSKIDEIDSDLRQLSLDIWEHPELGFKEFYTHDRLTSFMESHGWKVTRHHLGFETAWRAEFSHGEGGRVIGLQSEMDALPNLGHACGHNLIAITGVAIAIGLKAAMLEFDIAGKIILLGTPAEEVGGGKIKLLEKGAYDEMDVCLMAHPGPGVANSTALQPWIAVQNIDVEYFGHTAHAAYAPWEGQNALDAAFLAYSGISVLRQQMKPAYRVQGVVSGRDWEPNVIPDYAKMRWAVRAPTWSELEELRDRVIACFEGAALATACRVEITQGVGYKDCVQNDALAAEYLRLASSRYGMTAISTESVLPASSDFGDITYALPSIQPVYVVPIEKNGSNHTAGFARTARLVESHVITIRNSKAMAATGLRVLVDDQFWAEIRASFDARR